MKIPFEEEIRLPEFEQASGGFCFLLALLFIANRMYNLVGRNASEKR